MALLAEEIVEEWLNRQGYFTIRGIKLGVQEIDLLALRWQPDGAPPDCRHIEVQASMRPVSFISRVPRADQRLGRPKNSAKRSEAELMEGVDEWVETKFLRPDKRALMSRLWPGQWRSELVVNVVKSEPELALIAQRGIQIHRLPDIVQALAHPNFVVASAAGADVVDLILMGARQGTAIQAAHNPPQSSQV